MKQISICVRFALFKKLDYENDFPFEGYVLNLSKDLFILLYVYYVDLGMLTKVCRFLFGFLGVCILSTESTSNLDFFHLIFLANVVTYGSHLKLLNTAYNVRLHSHDIGYGSGSGQQSVTGLQDVTQKGSYWVVCSTGIENVYFFLIHYDVNKIYMFPGPQRSPNWQRLLSR